MPHFGEWPDKVKTESDLRGLLGDPYMIEAISQFARQECRFLKVDADDVAQEAFQRMWGRDMSVARNHIDRRTILGFFRNLVRNVAREHFRKDHKFKVDSDLPDTTLAAQLTPEQQLIADDEVKAMNREFFGLGELDQMVLRYSSWGMHLKDIAKAMDTSISTASRKRDAAISQIIKNAAKGDQIGVEMWKQVLKRRYRQYKAPHETAARRFAYNHGVRAGIGLETVYGPNQLLVVFVPDYKAWYDLGRLGDPYHFMQPNDFIFQGRLGLMSAHFLPNITLNSDFSFDVKLVDLPDLPISQGPESREQILEDWYVEGFDPQDRERRNYYNGIRPKPIPKTPPAPRNPKDFDRLPSESHWEDLFLDFAASTRIASPLSSGE